VDAPELSIIVPTLDEIDHIGALLDDLSLQLGVRTEIIVADGGSVDGTVPLCESRGARVVSASRGRGVQMNAGRTHARAPLLLFLHADSRLDHPRQLAQAVAAWKDMRDERVAGHFQLRFSADGPRRRAFIWYECLSALGRPETVNGDQGLLISARWLGRLGGFHETLPFLEDQDLGRRHLAAGGRWLLLPGRLHTSTRRFDREGLGARSIQNALIMALFSMRHPVLFADADGAYAPPGKGTAAGPVLARWIDAIAADLARRTPRERLQVVQQLGHYANRQGLWRAFFAVDVRRMGEAAARVHPCLDAYDRWLADPTDHVAVDTVLGMLSLGVMAGIRGR